jgi:branched-chain amino acid transport system substrate-binding protein
MASTRTVITLLVVGLIVGGIVGYGVSFVTQKPSSSTSVTTYTIGVIMPLSGTLASFGQSFANSVKLAANEMNSNLSAIGSPIRFNVVVADDGGTPSGALSALQSMYQSSSVQVVIGPLTSAEVLGVRDYADTNHIVILPPAATATSLRIAGDYILRPGQPGDQFEGTALAQTILSFDKKYVVYIYRGDTSEIGTYNITSAILKQNGVNVVGIEYTPGQSDYSNIVASASSYVASFESNGALPSQVAVVLGGYGTEAANMFIHASSDQYLSNVRWFGIEALNDNSLLSDSQVASFMAKVNLTITAPQTSVSPQGLNFIKAYTDVYGAPPEPYSNYAYDNAWIAMLSILVAGTDNGQALIKVVPLVADHYFGASGTGIYLDQYGDQTIAYYNVEKCVQLGQAFNFTVIGEYNGGTNQLTLNTK